MMRPYLARTLLATSAVLVVTTPGQAAQARAPRAERECTPYRCTIYWPNTNDSVLLTRPNGDIHGRVTIKVCDLTDDDRGVRAVVDPAGSGPLISYYGRKFGNGCRVYANRGYPISKVKATRGSNSSEWILPPNGTWRF